MKKTSITTLCKRFQQRNPNPVTELEYSTPFQLLTAVMLSAQATDRSVNKATASLFAFVKTPKDMIKLSQDQLEHYVKSINLFRTKAKHVLQTSHLLLECHHGKIPTTRQELLKLPGVGQKTANVVLNALYKHPTIAVDTHVFRVAKRIGLSEGKTPLAVEQDLEKSIPKKYLADCHHWLVLHGRYVCKAKKPLCSECFVSDLCAYYKMTSKNIP